MKNKEEIQKWIRDEISNPLIGEIMRKMIEDGVPSDEVMELMKPLIDNTPKVEEKLVRIKIGDEILKDNNIL